MSKKAKAFLFALFILLPFVFLGRDLAEFRYYAPEQSLEIDGIKIVYLDEGKGEAILLIHGFSGNIFNWKDVFEPLSREYRVLVPDLPGYGKSACPPRKQKHLILWYADFLARFLDRLGIEKAVVVGNSMGGAVAGWLAVRHPEKVEKLVLVDSAGLRMPLLELMAGLVALTPPKQMVSLVEMISPRSEKALSRLPESEQNRALLAQARYDSELRACSSRAMRRSILSLTKDLLDGNLKQIQAPTLIIWGDNDRTLSVKNAHKFKKKIPKAELKIIPQGGHTPMQNTPEQFLKVLKEFIEEK